MIHHIFEHLGNQGFPMIIKNAAFLRCSKIETIIILISRFLTE